MKDQTSKNGWTRIAGIRSVSKPAEQYIVAIRSSGYLGCSCKSYIYRKGTMAHDEFEVTCKHIRSMLTGNVKLADFDPTPFGTAWIQARIAAILKKVG